MQKLPIGIQSFKQIRKENYIYIDKTKEDFEEKIKAVLFQNQEKLGIKCHSKLPNRCLEELIQKAYKKYQKREVVLIDEYDKPILNVIENEKKAKSNREILRGIYEVLKDNDEYFLQYRPDLRGFITMEN